MTDLEIELEHLKIRSLVYDKYMISSRANRDLFVLGEWSRDYLAEHKRVDDEIQEIVRKIETSKGRPM